MRLYPMIPFRRPRNGYCCYYCETIAEPVLAMVKLAALPNTGETANRNGYWTRTSTVAPRSRLGSQEVVTVR